MDPEFLDYYRRELRFIREMSGEFARAYPKIAKRLALDEFEVQDPYVERLLEGFGFLTARIQLKIDAEFPQFTKQLLERVYPHFLAPLPSMTVLCFQPRLDNPALVGGGVRVPRHTALDSEQRHRQVTPCTFRTAHDLTLWPLELVEAEYLPTPAALASRGISKEQCARAGIRLALRSTVDVPIAKLGLSTLPLYLRGGDHIAVDLYRAFVGLGKRMLFEVDAQGDDWRSLPGEPVRGLGFRSDESLLPYGPQSFQGYRLLQEYFAMPERFLFVELLGLDKAAAHCFTDRLNLCVLLDSELPELEGSVEPGRLLLHCTPAANHFFRRAERAQIDNSRAEFHVIPDRARPLDFEVMQLTKVVGHDSGNDFVQEFRPFYSMKETASATGNHAFYSVRREPRVVSEGRQRSGTRTNYIGSEVFLSLVDADHAPFPAEIRQISLAMLCTNRDLPLYLRRGDGATDFVVDKSLPVRSVRSLVGPTPPRASQASGDTAWRLINHLTLNYLSLAEENSWRYEEERDRPLAPDGSPARALRDLLSLYGDMSDAALAKQVEGVVGLRSRPVTARVPSPGPVTFGRGLEVELTLDGNAFEGTGVFLFGAVMEQFFRKYTAINSFTRTVVRTHQNDEVTLWPARIGLRQVL